MVSRENPIPVLSQTQYEREKATRLMPEYLREFELYSWRLRTPDGSPFAFDWITCIATIEPVETSSLKIGLVIARDSRAKDIVDVYTRVTAEGFSTAQSAEGENIEIGYFLGSTDPYDLELAEMVQHATRDLVHA